MRLAINVNQSHILRGVKESPYRCALALAIEDRFKGTVSVGRTEGHFHDKTGEIAQCNLTDGKINFHIPPETWDFIKSFDAGNCPVPATLFIDVFRTASVENQL